VWAMLRRIGAKDRIPGLGKLLEMPA